MSIFYRKDNRPRKDPPIGLGEDAEDIRDAGEALAKIDSGESKTVPFDLESFVVATHEFGENGVCYEVISDEPRGLSQSDAMHRILQLLRTIRREGYTPHGAGTIAISERIEELEELLGGGEK